MAIMANPIFDLGTSNFSGVGKCPLFGDFEHDLQISVGDYIPNNRVMLNWDIYQPLFLGDTKPQLHPASSSVKYLGGSGQGMTWPEALEIRMASPSSVNVKPTSGEKPPFASWLLLTNL